MLRHLLTRPQKGGTCFQKLEEREFSLHGRNLAELCPAGRWETKFINDQLGCVGEEVSKQCWRYSLLKNTHTQKYMLLHILTYTYSLFVNIIIFIYWEYRFPILIFLFWKRQILNLKNKQLKELVFFAIKNRSLEWIRRSEDYISFTANERCLSFFYICPVAGIKDQNPVWSPWNTFAGCYRALVCYYSCSIIDKNFFIPYLCGVWYYAFYSVF